MQTTAGSTELDDQTRERRLGSELWARTKPLLDERDALRAEVQRLRAVVPNDAHARQCRTQAIEDLILLALENATLRAAVVEAIPCHRIGLVIKHLRKHTDRYEIERAPCHKTVKAILQKYGYL
ncbi:hypothetical protein SAMN04489798_2301 [Pseudomonas arsenicoxydans]|uniref:Uncharacterized protein n=1 Tax=Pseudomonas arsenicoxydans TaxID=702115 RepID=A0A1H0HM74_9PSED|nr:hypothetical protein [Pseudomonas arsenicoxydans]SDO19921.1 hypothetical protein SAMN04489798_2301 [Pseudomonas arsenicoxydans]